MTDKGTDHDSDAGGCLYLFCVLAQTICSFVLVPVTSCLGDSVFLDVVGPSITVIFIVFSICPTVTVKEQRLLKHRSLVDAMAEKYTDHMHGLCFVGRASDENLRALAISDENHIPDISQRYII